MADFPIFLTPQFGGDIQPLAIQFKPLDFTNLLKSVKATKPTTGAKDKKDALDFGAGTNGYNYQQKVLYEKGDELKREAMRKYGDAAINTPQYLQGVRMQEMATSEAVLTEKKRYLEVTNTAKANIKGKEDHKDLNLFFQSGGRKIFSLGERYSNEMENAYSLSLPAVTRTPEATVFNLDFTGEGSDFDIEHARAYTGKIFASADNQFFSTKTLGKLSEQIAALGGLAFPYLEQKSIDKSTDFGTLSSAVNTVLEEIEQGNINNPLFGGLAQGFVQLLEKNNGIYTIINKKRQDSYDEYGNLTRAGEVIETERKNVQVLGEDGFILETGTDANGEKYQYSKNLTDAWNNYVTNFVEHEFYNRYNTNYGESSNIKVGPKSGDGAYKKRQINEIYQGSTKSQPAHIYMRTTYGKKPAIAESFVTDVNETFQQFGYNITDNAFELVSDRMKLPDDKENIYHTYNKNILQNDSNKLFDKISTESDLIKNTFVTRYDKNGNVIAPSDSAEELLGNEPTVNIINTDDKTKKYVDITKIPGMSEKYPMIFSLASNLDEESKELLQATFEQNSDKSNYTQIAEAILALGRNAKSKSQDLVNEINLLNVKEDASEVVEQFKSEIKDHVFAQETINDINEELTKDKPKAKNVGNAVNFGGTWSSTSILAGNALGLQGSTVYEILGFQADNFKKTADGNWNFVDTYGNITNMPSIRTDSDGNYKPYSKESYKAHKEYNKLYANSPNAVANTTEELTVPMLYGVDWNDRVSFFNMLKKLKLRNLPGDEQINKKAQTEMQEIFYDGKTDGKTKKVPLYKAFQPVLLEYQTKGASTIFGQKGGKEFTNKTTDIPESQRMIFNIDDFSIEKEKTVNLPNGRTDVTKYTEYIDPISGKDLQEKNAKVSYRVSDFDYLSPKDFLAKYGVSKEYAQDYVLKIKERGGKTLRSAYDDKFTNGDNTFVTFDNNESSYTENPLKKGGALITYKVGDIERNAKETDLVNGVYNLARSRNNYSSYDRGQMATTNDVFNINITSNDDLIEKLTAFQADPNNKPDPFTPQARSILQPRIVYNNDNKPIQIQYTALLEITENIRMRVQGAENKSIIDILNETNPGMQQGSGMSGEEFSKIFNNK